MTATEHFDALAPGLSRAELDARYHELCGDAWLFAAKASKPAPVSRQAPAPAKGTFDALTASKADYEAAYREATRLHR